jgi:sRNA-binding regulator protein Hfq
MISHTSGRKLFPFLPQSFHIRFGRNAHLHQVITRHSMAKSSAVSSSDEDDAPEGAQIPSLPPSGPRKLVRPSLPAGAQNRRSYTRRDAALLTHQHPSTPSPTGHAAPSHAETFYLQKQMHAQTQMVFVLEGGDRVEGAIEWYDTDVIKVRHGNVRTLIYKPSIKYLYKAGEPTG